MIVTKYKTTTTFEVLDTLFLKDDTIYFSGSIYVMNGRIDYGRKVFDSSKKCLGMIRDDKFYKEYQPFLQEFKHQEQ